MAVTVTSNVFVTVKDLKVWVASLPENAQVEILSTHVYSSTTEWKALKPTSIRIVSSPTGSAYAPDEQNEEA